MGNENYPHKVSRTMIYSLVARSGWQHLLAARVKRTAKSQKPARARLIPNRVDIAERSSRVDDKEEIGHWEADTVYGQDVYLVTLAERRQSCS